jgi:hypothetical protein
VSSRKRSRISGQFAARLIEMLESPAYRVLSLSAHRIISRVEIELGHHGGKDNGKLPITYDDFQAYGIDRHAIAPAIREAEALGFIEVTVRGRAGNAEFRTPNLFRLTFRGAKGLPGDGTHEWRKIADLEQATLVAQMARKTKPEKTKSQCGETPVYGGGIPHRNGKNPVRLSPTTCHGGFSPTTLYISGRVQSSSMPFSAPLISSMGGGYPRVLLERLNRLSAREHGTGLSSRFVRFKYNSEVTLVVHRVGGNAVNPMALDEQ